jgi:FlaA1/EpsC-like NDP-sugar epimerase
MQNPKGFLEQTTPEEMTLVHELRHQEGADGGTMSELDKIIEHQGLSGQIRGVALEDLLGRTSVRLREGLIRASIEGRVVMATGAAGSIRADLCRQIAR